MVCRGSNPYVATNIFYLLIQKRSIHMLYDVTIHYSLFTSVKFYKQSLDDVKRHLKDIFIAVEVVNSIHS